MSDSIQCPYCLRWVPNGYAHYCAPRKELVKCPRCGQYKRSCGTCACSGDDETER